MKKIYLIFTVLILTILISIPKVYALTPSTTDVGGFNLYSIYDMMIGTPDFTIDYDNPKEVIIELDLLDTTYKSTVRNVVISGIDYISMLYGLFTNPTDVASVNVMYETSLDDTNPQVPYIYETSFNIWYFNSHDYLQVSPFFFGYIKPTEQGVFTRIEITVRSYTNDLILQTLPDISPILDKIYIFRAVNSNDWSLYLTQRMLFDWLAIIGDEYAFQSGKESGVNIGYNQAKNDYGLRNGVYGNANYWYSEGQMADYSAWEDIMQGFFGPFNILNYELLPGFRIGYVFAFFMIIGVLGFLIGKRKM